MANRSTVHRQWRQLTGALVLAASSALAGASLLAGCQQGVPSEQRGEVVTPTDGAVATDAAARAAPACALLQARRAFEPLWAEPQQLPGLPDEAGPVKRVKVARGDTPGSFVAFYSTMTQQGGAILARAFSATAEGVAPLCGGQSFAVFDGRGGHHAMDFNVTRIDGAAGPEYVVAHTIVPVGGQQHDVRAARVALSTRGCRSQLLHQRSIKVLADNDCEKGGEPWTLQTDAGLYFAEWWQEVGPEREAGCDLGDGDLALRLRPLDDRLADDATRSALSLRSGPPYSSADYRLFLDPGRHSPLTRLIHGTARGGGPDLYLCYNGSANGQGAQAFNRTAAGTFVNILCARYQVDTNSDLRIDPGCSTLLEVETPGGELFLQGVTLLAASRADDPLLALYSFESDGTTLCHDGGERCFDELRLTDLGGRALTVFGSGAPQWGPSQDGFVDGPLPGGVERFALLAAVRQDRRAPYVQLVLLGPDA